MTQTLTVRTTAPSSELLTQTLRIFSRVLREYGAYTLQETDQSADVELALDAGIAPDGFTLSQDGSTLRIAASNAAGLLYGVGKFLHTSTYTATGFTPTTWRGTSVSDCSMRGIYMANNFSNWNYSSTLEEMKNYLDELALWGMNTIAFNFPLYDNLKKEHIRNAYLERNRQIIAHANALGMKVVLLYAPNFLGGTPPEGLQAHPFPDTNPARRGAGDNPVKFVCPSNPAGREYLLERIARDLDCYEGLGIHAIATFPYDAGGCGCEQCWPWGAKGFPMISRDVIRLARERWENCKLILCTWCYDVREESDGEYEGLETLLASDNDWCDIIMADAHGDFPKYPLEHGVPGGLPMINFAEISMWGRFPWGGSGANPFPRRVVNIWNQAAHLLDGGLPYSEGRFEDINKIACLSLFWNKSATASEIVHAYANFEYGSDVANQVCQAVELLEDNYPTADLETGRAREAYALLQTVAKALPESVQNRWRWRILFLRALIDNETISSPEIVTAEQNAAYEELTEIYCAQKAGGPVAPRAKSFFERADIDQKGPTFAEHIGEHASDPAQIR